MKCVLWKQIDGPTPQEHQEKDDTSIIIKNKHSSYFKATD